MRKVTKASTLMRENKNSSSRNTFTETRFRPRQGKGGECNIHWGISASIGTYFLKKFIYRATAVTSTMAIMDQLSQYSQPTVNAAFSEEFTSVRDKGTRRRAVQHQVTEGAQDEEREEAADRVDENEGGSGRCKASACSHEQAGSDGTSNPDHLHLPGAQALVVTLFLIFAAGVSGVGALGAGRCVGRRPCRVRT
jgi:hypothetical protein